LKTSTRTSARSYFWALRGRRQRTAAASAAAGKPGSPAVVLSLLEALQTAQEKVREQQSSIDSLLNQRRLMLTQRNEVGHDRVGRCRLERWNPMLKAPVHSAQN